MAHPQSRAVAPSLQIEDEKTWIRRKAAFVLDLSNGKADLSRFLHDDRVMHGTRVARFEDAYVFGRDQILSGGDPLLLSGKNYSAAALELCLDRVASEPERSDDVATFIGREDDVYAVPEGALADAIVLDEPVFLATPDEPYNYGMWMLYSVTGTHLYRRCCPEEPKVLAMTDLPWQRAMLTALGVPDDRIIRQDMGRVYKVPEVISVSQTYRTLMLADVDTEAFTDLTSGLERVEGYEKIFVSRLSRTTGYRILANEADLVVALAARGFTIIEPDRFDFVTQARIFHSASVVVGLGGAGMFNVAFCRPGAKVVDIENGMDFVDGHINLFASRGVDFGIVIGEEDADDLSLHHKRWSLNVPAALNAIDAFLRG